MNEWMRRLLAAPGAGARRPHDERVAMAALLVLAAKADQSYADAEAVVVGQALKARYRLSDAEAAALRAQGEAAEEAAMDHYQFTKAIKEAVPHEAREGVAEALWRVILADSSRDPHEDALMRQLIDRLGLSPLESAQARQRAAAGG